MLTYAEAEFTLASIFKADSKAQVGAFRGRLKHLKRLGIPLGSNPGRGKKIGYQRNELYQWLFCLELEEFGIDPSIIVKIVRRYWLEWFGPGFEAVAKDNPDAEETLFCFAPQLMSAGWRPEQEFRGIGPPFGFRGRNGLKDLIDQIGEGDCRISLFIVSRRVRQIEEAFHAKENQR
jgi:hypothetical protein